MLNLKPGQVAAASDRLQDRNISGGEGQRARLSATHGPPPVPEAGVQSQHTGRPNLLHYFVPGPLARQAATRPFGLDRSPGKFGKSWAEARR